MFDMKDKTTRKWMSSLVSSLVKLTPSLRKAESLKKNGTWDDYNPFVDQCLYDWLNPLMASAGVTYEVRGKENIPLDEKDREAVRKVMDEDPLALIEYWSIDPDYDGVTFRSLWQDYRENTAMDHDPLHCVYRADLTVPHKESRAVCVKAVDVFGFESVVVERIL